MSEKSIEKACIAAATRNGWLARKLQWVARRDAPDRVFIKDGRIVFVEFKEEGEEARPSQAYEHEILRAVGCEVHVIDNLKDFNLKVICDVKPE